MYFQTHFDGHLPNIERTHLDYNLTDQAYTFHLHKDVTELVYVDSGSGIYMINHQHFPVERGDFLVIERGFVHSGASSIHNPMKTLVLVVSDVRWKDQEYPEYVIPPGTYPVMKANTHMPYISGTMAEIYRLMKDPHPDMGLCRMILAPMLVLLRNYCYHTSEIYWQMEENPLASDILSYIYTHYAEDITLEHLSQHFFMSAGHINHLLQKEFGISPINYLIDVRFSKSKALLINSNLSIAKIAYSVGYNNPAHFTKLFTKRVGYSPQDYRLLHNNVVPE